MTIQGIITFDELSEGVESEKADNKFRISAQLLIDALNDWPTQDLSEPKDLLIELREEIGKPLTFDNLDSYLKRLTIQDAWKIESVTSLLEMFDFEQVKSYDRSITLEMIIAQLTSHYRGQSRNHPHIESNKDGTL